jgi:hypothetical protein
MKNQARRFVMGFRVEPTIYNLSFQGTPLDGLHVKMSCCTVREYNQMLKATVIAPIDFDEETEDTAELRRVSKELYERSREVYANNEQVLELFATHLVSWDLEDPIDGTPVPTTREGIDSQERPFISQLIQAWQSAMVNIPNLSKSESSNGSISQERSLGLGNISESQTN